MTTLFHSVQDAISTGRMVAIATVIAGPGLGNKLIIHAKGPPQGSLGSAKLDESVFKRVTELMVAQRSERLTIPISDTLNDETVEIFVDVQAPPAKLVIVGAVHIAIHLVTFGNALGFETVVVDARSAFATPDRFPHVDRLITQWPADALTELGLDESTCLVVLTHDEKLDNPALEVAVKSPALYIGALGSRKTHARRVTALKEMGVTDKQIERIHAPIGLNLGGRRPEEIAVSIIAQIVAVRNGQLIADG